MKIKLTEEQKEYFQEISKDTHLGHSVEFFYSDDKLWVDYISEGKKYLFDQFMKTQKGQKILIGLVGYLSQNKSLGFTPSGHAGLMRDELKDYIINKFSDYKNPLDVVLSQDFKVLRMNFD